MSPLIRPEIASRLPFLQESSVEAFLGDVGGALARSSLLKGAGIPIGNIGMSLLRPKSPFAYEIYDRVKLNMPPEHVSSVASQEDKNNGRFAPEYRSAEACYAPAGATLITINLTEQLTPARRVKLLTRDNYSFSCEYHVAYRISNPYITVTRAISGHDVLEILGTVIDEHLIEYAARLHWDQVRLEQMIEILKLNLTDISHRTQKVAAFTGLQVLTAAPRACDADPDLVAKRTKEAERVEGDGADIRKPIRDALIRQIVETINREGAEGRTLEQITAEALQRVSEMERQFVSSERQSAQQREQIPPLLQPRIEPQLGSMSYIDSDTPRRYRGDDSE